jgi:hypothetical protein
MEDATLYGDLLGFGSKSYRDGPDILFNLKVERAPYM